MTEYTASMKVMIILTACFLEYLIAFVLPPYAASPGDIFLSREKNTHAGSIIKTAVI
jgi:hypothetical protein